MPNINHKIISWAREEAGLSIEEAARLLKLGDGKAATAAEKLAAIEAGKAPSRPQLLKMVRVYRRPLLTFYLDKVPRKVDQGEDFRTLSSALDAKQDYRVSVLIRDVRAGQSIVRQALIDEDEATPISFIGSCSMSSGVARAVNALGELIGMTLAEFRAQRSAAEAFKLLRTKIEDIGVFVLLKGNLGSHHTNIGLDVFRGFALSDEIAPFVVLNHQEATSARAFTLLHEMTHLLLGQTGIGGERTEKKIEKFCDQVASEYLLPDSELATVKFDVSNYDALMNDISCYAQERHISSNQLAYRLFARKILRPSMYRNLRDDFYKLWIENREQIKKKNQANEGGPNANVLRRSYLGGLVRFVERMNAAGVLSVTKSAIVLGIKPLKVSNLFGSAVTQG